MWLAVGLWEDALHWQCPIGNLFFTVCGHLKDYWTLSWLHVDGSSVKRVHKVVIILTTNIMKVKIV